MAHCDCLSALKVILTYLLKLTSVKEVAYQKFIGITFSNETKTHVTFITFTPLQQM